MGEKILKVEDISKQYRLGNVGTGTLRDDLKRWSYKIRGKEDPFLKIGEANDRASFGDSDYVWALKAINFEVKRGEVLGIIGKNGAGKSTLLKLLSRVTSPTTGTIKSKGRIASLLEVGTGFHPEMTGRENIFLNGAILGMTKSEIKAKENEIIEFSGCQRYIDTPVKRYSSGMRVRLAFAVAAHLEPDILVVDEVLAVGDAEFQKKAIGKMQDISQGQGRTVLFVSHNMAAVRSLCTRVIVLEYGKAIFEGNVGAAIDFYLKQNSTKNIQNFKSFSNYNFNGNDILDLISIGIKAEKESYNSPINVNDRIEFNIKLMKKQLGCRIDVTIKIKDGFGKSLITIPSSLCDTIIDNTEQSGIISYSLKFPTYFFSASDFYIDVLFIKNHQKTIMMLKDIISFNTLDEKKRLGTWMGKLDTPFRMKLEWQRND